LASGHKITVNPVPDEMIYFTLAKEFGWTPSQIKNEKAKDIKAIMTILNSYNITSNQEMKRITKKGKH
jgi:hypothetical protein